MWHWMKTTDDGGALAIVSIMVTGKIVVDAIYFLGYRLIKHRWPDACNHA